MTKARRKDTMESYFDNAVFSAKNKENYDLIVYQCGMSKCEPAHSFGPAVRDHYLIHYVLEGKGSFHVEGKNYRLNKNEGFLICPDVVTYYEADIEEPWSYAWVGFKGIKAEAYLKQANLHKNNPIFKHEEGSFIRRCLDEMRMAAKLKFGSDLRLQGLLSVFLSELIEMAEVQQGQGANYKEMYLKRTLQFIETNYSRDITVSDMAQYIGLNKNYFSTFFKENLRITPQEYLIRYRVNKACELMKNQVLTIAEISRSVGYNDPLGFSKIFKKVKGLPPKKYREKIDD